MSAEFPVGLLEDKCAKMHSSIYPQVKCHMYDQQEFSESQSLLCVCAGWMLFVKHYVLGVPPASCSLNPVPGGGSSESPILPALPTAPVQHPHKHTPASPLLPLPTTDAHKRRGQCSVQDTSVPRAQSRLGHCLAVRRGARHFAFLRLSFPMFKAKM